MKVCPTPVPHSSKSHQHSFRRPHKNTFLGPAYSIKTTRPCVRFSATAAHNLCDVATEQRRQLPIQTTRHLANWKIFSGRASASALHWIISQMPWHSCASLAIILTCSWSTGMIVLYLAVSGLSVPCELGRPDAGYQHVGSITFKHIPRTTSDSGTTHWAAQNMPHSYSGIF